MSDEPTPRTDAECERTLGDPSPEFAKGLELEIRELERELAAKAHALELSNTAYGQMFREREELERENARLVATIQDLLAAHEAVYPHERWACMEQAAERAAKALASPETKQRAG